MSIETWDAEFYPTEACSDAAKAAPAAHSLIKWIGKRPENLAKHDLERTGRLLHEKLTPANERLVGSSSCALCAVFHDEATGSYGCSDCTYTLANGQPCDKPPSRDELSPWHTWLHDGNPEPMIEGLLKAKELEDFQRGDK